MENIAAVEQTSSIDQAIENSIAEFNPVKAHIAEYKAKFLSLTIKDVTDKTGYAEIVKARKLVKTTRVAAEKRKDEVNADALKFQRAINAAWAEIESDMKQIESYLSGKEKWFEKEQERIKKEKEEQKLKVFTERVNKLMSISFKPVGATYVREEDSISISDLQSKSDEQFELFYKQAEENFHAYVERQLQEKKAQEERESQLAEEARQDEERKAKIREMERKMLEEQTKANLAREEELKRQQLELEKQQEEMHKKEQEMERKRQAVIDQFFNARKTEYAAVGGDVTKLNRERTVDMDDTGWAAFLENQMKITAKLKAEAEAAEKDRQEKERIFKENQAKEAELQKPDRAKLLAIAKELPVMEMPAMNSDKGKAVINNIRLNLQKISDYILEQTVAMAV